MNADTLCEIERILDYKFSNPALIEEALSHSSQADNRLSSNERMEFLGDSVLALVICCRLFNQFPDYLEGDLTKIKSMLVSRKTCAKLAGKLGLQDYINVGKGMTRTRALSGSIAAGTFEAVIAAIYLDGGFEEARRFLLRLFNELIANADAEQHQDNFKSVLQQYAQQNTSSTPIYSLLDEKGPDHNKCFEVAVVLNNHHFRSAWGVTKKDAEQSAAYNALVELGILQAEQHSEMTDE